LILFISLITIIEQYFEMIMYQQFFTEKERPVYVSQLKSMNHCIRKSNLRNSFQNSTLIGKEY